jgi:hypothetical protein
MRRVLLASLSCLLAHAAGGGTILVKGRPFLAEVAVTEAEKVRGLMYRQFLAKDRCMILLFDEEGAHPVRMKNCMVPLDVAWVGVDGAVVELAENIPPVPPRAKASEAEIPSHGGMVLSRHVVELPAGTIRRLGLKKGDRLGWDLTLDDGSVVKGGAASGKKPAKKAGRK